jgi:uncharacterized membrane protein YccC
MNPVAVMVLLVSVIAWLCLFAAGMSSRTLAFFAALIIAGFIAILIDAAIRPEIDFTTPDHSFHSK